MLVKAVQSPLPLTELGNGIQVWTIKVGGALFERQKKTVPSRTSAKIGTRFSKKRYKIEPTAAGAFGGREENDQTIEIELSDGINLHEISMSE